MNGEEGGEFSEDELLRIDRAEALAFEALYAAAADKLGTGSERLGDALAIWHPLEEEAGYSYLLNFHLAADLDRTYDTAVRLIRDAGSQVFGVPIDDRVSAWATPDRLSDLGLSYGSDELIWARRIDPGAPAIRPAPPEGITIGPCDLSEDELTRVINLGWNLEETDIRGQLYSAAPGIPGWTHYLARSGEQIAGYSVLCGYERVGILMLAVVMPEFRGRGLQSYFIAQRLADAAMAGCTLAISETNDDNASPRNLQRAGFRLCVKRQVYSRSLE